MKITPVKLAPGRLRLATSPSRTGSVPVANTTGTVVATAFAANAPAVLATITAACRSIRSVTKAGSRSLRPSAQRCSITTLRPSTKPASVRPRRNAARMCSNDIDGVLRRKPTTGMDGCCARAPSGHTAAPPSSVMNWRRPISDTEIPLCSVFRSCTLPHWNQQVLRADLNRSESAARSGLG
jgi:hypothetical protein